MAFAPDYQSSGRFYVDYTGSNGDLQIVQYRRATGDRNLADGASARSVLAIPHHRYSNHNGGQLQFGPDGDLYIGVGDGGNEDDPMNEGQNNGVLAREGAADRAWPERRRLSIPAGNPFAGEPGRRPEIWADGLRNPWRFSFDRLSGALIIGDVGQDQQERGRLRRSRRGGRRQLWLGASSRGSAATSPAGRRARCSPSSSRFTARGIARSSAGTWSETGRCRRCMAATSTGTCQAGDQIGCAQPRPRDRGSGTGLSVRDMSAFGQDALGRVYAASLDGPVYRLAQGELR